MNVEIELTEPVALTFSLKYLVNFCKAAGLSKTVKLCLSNEVPLLVEYSLAGSSYLRFYLAPKVCSWVSIVYTYANYRSRLVMRNRRVNGGTVINDGMRFLQHIPKCGVMVDFMDTDDCCLFTCMGARLWNFQYSKNPKNYVFTT